MTERVGTCCAAARARPRPSLTFPPGLTSSARNTSGFGYARFSIFDESDTRALLTDIMQKEYSGDDGVDEIKTIGAWKNDLILPEEGWKRPATPSEQTAAIVYPHYQRTPACLQRGGLDDLILQPVKLFQEHPDVLQGGRTRCAACWWTSTRTNASQYLLVKLLVKDRAQFTVVGDDDQPIYAWRGARRKNLMQLKEDFPSLKVVMLEQNYRSTSRILARERPHRQQPARIREAVVERDGPRRSDPGDPLPQRGRRSRAHAGDPHLHLRTERPYSEFAILPW